MKLKFKGHYTRNNFNNLISFSKSAFRNQTFVFLPSLHRKFTYIIDIIQHLLRNYRKLNNEIIALKEEIKKLKKKKKTLYFSDSVTSIRVKNSERDNNSQNTFEQKLVSIKTFETEQIETEQIETEQIETEQIETEQIETEQIETEQIENESYDTKKQNLLEVVNQITLLKAKQYFPEQKKKSKIFSI